MLLSLEAFSIIIFITHLLWRLNSLSLSYIFRLALV